MIVPATVPEQVSLAKDMEISYRTLHPSLVISNVKDDDVIRVPYSSIINKYKDFLSTIVVEIKLDDAMREKYMYKPKMVSNELYGTTELWSEILILNNAYSVIEFRPRVLKCYDPNRFKSFINEIILFFSIIGTEEDAFKIQFL